MAVSRISFVTMNLYNLQVPRRKMYPQGAPYSRKEYESKLRFVARILQDTQADVYGFQELWAARALRDAFDMAKLQDQYDFIARDAPGIGRPQVALAARKGMIDFAGKNPNDDSWWVEPFPEELVLKKRRTIDKVTVGIDRFSRPILSAMVKPLSPGNAPDIRVFVGHLKSKRPTYLDREEEQRPEVKAHDDAIGSALASVRRTAEAAALRVMLNKSMTGNVTPHVLLGDMNNGSLAVSTSILTGEPRYKLIETSRPVRGKRADLGLYSVEQLQQYRSQRHTMYTHIYENKLETLDHILVSEEFYDHSPNRHWSFVETRVWNDHLHMSHKRNRNNPPLVWPTDHAVVEAEFQYNPFT